MSPVVFRLCSIFIPVFDIHQAGFGVDPEKQGKRGEGVEVLFESLSWIRQIVGVRAS